MANKRIKGQIKEQQKAVRAIRRLKKGGLSKIDENLLKTQAKSGIARAKTRARQRKQKRLAAQGKSVAIRG